MDANTLFAHALFYPPTIRGMTAPSNDDRICFAGIFTDSHDFAVGDELIQEDVTDPRVFVIEEGWLACYKLLRNGGRQVIDFQLPGDILGLRDLMLLRASHTSVALTRVRARSASADRFVSLMEHNSRLMAGTFWMLGREEADVVDSLVRLGQQTAVERTADMIYRLWLRLDHIGQADGGGFSFPVSHLWLSEALGISTVHLSRTLRKLHELGLLEMRNRKVRVMSRDRLVKFIAGEGPHTGD